MVNSTGRLAGWYGLSAIQAPPALRPSKSNSTTRIRFSIAVQRATDRLLFWQGDGEENKNRRLLCRNVLDIHNKLIPHNEELKTKERVIEGLEYELESCREDVAELEQREVCQYDSCKFEDVCLEMEDVISNIKRR